MIHDEDDDYLDEEYGEGEEIEDEEIEPSTMLNEKSNMRRRYYWFFIRK